VALCEAGIDCLRGRGREIEIKRERERERERGRERDMASRELKKDCLGMKCLISALYFTLYTRNVTNVSFWIVCLGFRNTTRYI
jgi:hypothetical protein